MGSPRDARGRRRGRPGWYLARDPLPPAAPGGDGPPLRDRFQQAPALAGGDAAQQAHRIVAVRRPARAGRCGGRSRPRPAPWWQPPPTGSERRRACPRAGERGERRQADARCARSAAQCRRRGSRVEQRQLGGPGAGPDVRAPEVRDEPRRLDHARAQELRAARGPPRRACGAHGEGGLPAADASEGTASRTFGCRSRALPRRREPRRRRARRGEDDEPAGAPPRGLTSGQVATGTSCARSRLPGRDARGMGEPGSYAAAE